MLETADDKRFYYKRKSEDISLLGKVIQGINDNVTGRKKKRKKQETLKTYTRGKIKAV